METFSVLLAFCAGNSPVTGKSRSQSPVSWGFDVFFDLRLEWTVEYTIAGLLIRDDAPLIVTSV